MLIWWSILLGSWLLFSCQTSAEFVHNGPKLKGVNLVAPPRPTGPESLADVKAMGGDWVAVVPYGFNRKGEAHFYHPWTETRRNQQWWGETPAGVKETIRMAQQQGLKVMLKPHVWMQGGSHLDLEFTREEDWQTFEADYTRYVLECAKLADSLKVDLYCITTELDRFAVARPAYWSRLIDQVRQVYHGKLTYAANWDRYDKIPFWKQLDYVGVDAYFPLSDDQTPSVSALNRGWRTHLKELQRFSQRQQKSILFTEFGYRACDYGARQPWESESTCTPNPTTQANAYSALMETVWPQPWFAGGFLWKWFMTPQPPGMPDRRRDQYSPQDKAAGEVLRAKWK
ncbi:hypothetical protein GCM10023189_00770 [Nibrella saemangeumensis]|uniref:GTA TIM-barrel-like domain-containing protein n=1 Tax=Nibrella saemangeumensis TaxID=1084526 RepID=A0ABP8MA42_9BACT